MKYDICVIGSGAGAGPVIYEASKAGFSVVVLEKGPWFKTGDFRKDEIANSRRSVYTPNLKDEQHVIESLDSDGKWEAKSTFETGYDFWKGNVVGGSSNFMSGYFHRMKPKDFRLLSEYGPIKGANIVDWPITYDDLEPYYTKVEQLVGISGRVVGHSTQEPRSTDNFPYPPLAENVVSGWIDAAAENIGYKAVPIPRAILSQPKDKRQNCSYSNYCGSYGCATDAKGSSRAALINQAFETGNCEIIPQAKVFKLETDGAFKLKKAWFYDTSGNKQFIEAQLFVLAARAEETSRLLLMSKNAEFPNGLANNSGQVGKNLIFSAGGTGSGQFYYDDLSPEDEANLKLPGLFVNRSIHQWYEINDEQFGGKAKGGIIDLLFEHANGVSKSVRQKWNSDGSLVYGTPLKEKLKNYFTRQRRLRFEVFADWLPNDNCFVTLDPEIKDKWGDPVTRMRIGYHNHDLKVGEYLARNAEKLMVEMGAKNIRYAIDGSPPANLISGGCRFGTNPKESVLDKNCKAHEVDNLYVTDGSFMPTGGSVTYTWTIYANSFRVSDVILDRLTVLNS